MSTIDVGVASDSEFESSPPVQQPGSNRNLLLIVAAIIAAVLWFQSQKSQPAPQPDDGTVVVDDDKQVQPQPGPSLKGTHLVYVFEATGYPVYIDDVIESQTTESLKAAGFTGWRSYDDDMDEVKELVDFAASKNIAVPFVALVKDLKSKQPVKIEPMPKTPQALLEFLK